jgi:predicted lysophospholipase L1 biosynthesis ABC-type transport system permease subunit
LREQFAAVTAGLVLGAAVSYWGIRFVQASLDGLTGYDTHLWFAALGVIILTAATGTLLPALRVCRTEPVRALKAD